MFGGWRNTQIKAAQRALDQGRLDDAFAAATRPDVLADRDAQRLLDDLARPLLARARLHMQAGRYADALQDINRLTVINRPNDESRELQQRAEANLSREVAATAENEQAYRRAAEDLRAGHLESGRVQVERIADERQRRELSDELDYRERRAREMLDQAVAAHDRGDALAAVRLWQDAIRRHGQTRDTDGFAIRCAATVRSLVQRAFDDGAIARALAARAALDALRKHDPTLAEQEQLLSLCHLGAGQLAQRDYVALRQTLLRLKAVGGEPKWLAAALEAAGRAVEMLDTLLASPLGAALHNAPEIAAAAAPARDQLDIRHAAPAGPIGARSNVLLLVDGTASVLLLRGKTVRIGRLGADCDIPFPFDVQSNHAEIERDGEDYFLTAYGPAFVNQRRTTRTLLRDGDRILLGARAKMVFQKPSAKSATAVLKLSTSSRLPQDVSEVVLFSDTCIVGPSPSCHVRTREGVSQVVLFERGGEIVARTAGAANRPPGESQTLAIGRTGDFGDVRITAKQYDPRQVKVV